MTRFILPALIIYGLCSCGGPSGGTLSRQDSLQIAMAICGDTVPVTQKDTVPVFKQLEFVSMLDIKRAIPQPIPEDSAQNMVTSYHRAAHQLPIVNRKGERVKGFVLDSNDFNKIIADAGKIKSLIFYLGVHNYNEANNQNQKPEYTMLIVPIKKDGKADRKSVYDYVLPCPDNCPDDGFEPLK